MYNTNEPQIPSIPNLRIVLVDNNTLKEVFSPVGQMGQKFKVLLHCCAKIDSIGFNVYHRRHRNERGKALHLPELSDIMDTIGLRIGIICPWTAF